MIDIPAALELKCCEDIAIAIQRSGIAVLGRSQLANELATVLDKSLAPFTYESACFTADKRRL